MRGASDARREVAERLSLSLAVAGAVAAATWFLANPAVRTADYQFYARAARLWWGGVDPYAMRPTPPFAHLWPLWDRLFYPLPALLMVGPFAALPVRLGHTLFITAAAWLLAWRMTRDARWPLLLFAGPSFLMAAMTGQWSPWLTLGALVPSAGFLLAAKPTLGLACFLYRPTWKAVASGAAVMAVSLVLMPAWPREWLDNLKTVVEHPPPIAEPAGFLLVLALVRWRQPEARFLLAMACVPQLGLWADQLPLFLVCRTRREAILYTLGSAVAFVVWCVLIYQGTPGKPLPPEPYVLLGSYGSALYIVLRRPNEGTLPAWRASLRWPAWSRRTA